MFDVGKCTNLLAVVNEGSDTIRWILFWLKATWLAHTTNVLIVKFHTVVRVVKFTDKLEFHKTNSFHYREKTCWGLQKFGFS